MNKLKRVHFAAVGRELHIDVPLSNVAIDHRPQEMIADMLCPIVDVPNISGQIPIFNVADQRRIEKDYRAPGTPARRIVRNVSSDSFLCVNHALATGVNIEDLNNADPIYVQKLFNGGAQFLKGQLMLNYENRVALQVNSTSNVGSSAAVSSAWTDYTNSDPLSDLNTAIDNVQDTTGVRPNRLTFGITAWRNCRRNDNVRNLIYGTNNGGGYISREQIAQVLEVEQVLVGGAYKNTAAEGQDESLSKVWNNNVLVSYSPQNPSIWDPSFMYGFRWSVNGIPNMQVERHPYNTVRKEYLIELGYYQDEKIVGAEYSYLLLAVDSST